MMALSLSNNLSKVSVSKPSIAEVFKYSTIYRQLKGTIGVSARGSLTHDLRGTSTSRNSGFLKDQVVDVKVRSSGG